MGAVPAFTGAEQIRLTFRAPAGGPLVCDALLPLDGARRAVAIPDPGGDPVDLWVEYFGAPPDPARLAAGVSRGIDLAAGGDVPVRVWPAEQFACAGGLQVTARAFHTATLLPTGEVLIVGGAVAHPEDLSDELTAGPDDRRRLFATASVEIYDPVRARATQLSAGSLQPRALHQAALISTDPIQVAVFGGLTINGDVTQAPVLVEGTGTDLLRWMPGPQAISAATEILTYDPASSTITVTLVDDPTARGLLAAAAPEGPVGAMPPVIAGGFTDATASAAVLRADALDPAALTPTGMATLASPRIGATLTPLDADDALLWGGHIPPAATPPSPPGERLVTLASAPAAQALTFDGASAAAAQRAFHAAARAGDGSVIVAGGFTIDAAGALVPEPRFGQRIQAGAMVLVSDLAITDAVPAGYLAALSLPGGDVLISGGNPAIDDAGCIAADPGIGCATGAAYLYHDASTALARTGVLVRPRYGQQTTLLADGTVLVSGGLGIGGALEVVDDAEIYDPRTADPLVDLAPGVTRLPGDVARDGADQPVATCPVIEIEPAP
ncbi:MAG TPA: hypothetical protein VL172_05000 [Kofleriaceae bacterium]|nr:hypothetical protein [Kofleriaceae bacterium]